MIYTADEVLARGLKIAGWHAKRAARLSRETQIEYFKDSFGVAPIVYAQIWDDLQNANFTFVAKNGATENVRIDTSRRSCTLDTFLKAVRFLKKYDTEKDRAGQTGDSDRFCREWGWFFLARVAALRKTKASFFFLFLLSNTLPDISKILLFAPQ